MAICLLVFSQNWRTMKFSEMYLGSIASVLSKEEFRYTLRQPYLDVPKKLFLATNGHSLVAIPVTVGEGDTSGVVDIRAVRYYQSAMKKWRKKQISFGRKSEITEPKLICAETVVFQDSDGTTMSFPRDGKAQFPKTEDVFAKLNGTPVHLDAVLLKKLYDAMRGDSKTDGITLWVPKEQGGAIAVSLLTRPRASLGVLMPMRSDAVKMPTLETLER